VSLRAQKVEGISGSAHVVLGLDRQLNPALRAWAQRQGLRHKARKSSYRYCLRASQKTPEIRKAQSKRGPLHMAVNSLVQNAACSGVLIRDIIVRLFELAEPTDITLFSWKPESQAKRLELR
jgi:hypothetical protein